MVHGDKASRWTFKRIVQDGDNWEQYQRVYAGQVTAHQIAEVEKMLGCRDPRNGFATYICLDCGEKVQVPFSCKSRVCSSCGKVHAEEWAEQLARRMFNVTHRHITFTVPDSLWSEFEEEAERRGVLFQAAGATLKKVMGVEPGIVVVLHPYCQRPRNLILDWPEWMGRQRKQRGRRRPLGSKGRRATGTGRPTGEWRRDWRCQI